MGMIFHSNFRLDPPLPIFCSNPVKMKAEDELGQEVQENICS